MYESEYPSDMHSEHKVNDELRAEVLRKASYDPDTDSYDGGADDRLSPNELKAIVDDILRPDESGFRLKP